MDAEMRFPVLARDFQKRLWLRDAGVVDQHVDSAELAHGTCDELLDLIVVTHVGAAEEDTASELSISLAVACAASSLTSAKPISAPSRAKLSAISLPIPRPLRSPGRLILKLHDSTSVPVLLAVPAKIDRTAPKMKGTDIRHATRTRALEPRASISPGARSAIVQAIALSGLGGASCRRPRAACVRVNSVRDSFLVPVALPVVLADRTAAAVGVVPYITTRLSL